MPGRNTNCCTCWFQNGNLWLRNYFWYIFTLTATIIWKRWYYVINRQTLRCSHNERHGLPIITSLTIVYLTVYSGADQRKHQSSAPLAFVKWIHQWPVNFPHKGRVTRKNVTIGWRHYARKYLINENTRGQISNLSLRECIWRIMCFRGSVI